MLCVKKGIIYFMFINHPLLLLQDENAPVERSVHPDPGR
jgi:hypothetical protein